jgi:hypothetical protein
MLRASILASVFASLLASALVAGCRHDTDPPPVHPQDGEPPPPLPPSSGTPVGYLLDNATTLALRDDQLTKLSQIDKSLAVQDDAIDTQLRLIEKHDEEPAEKGQPPPRHNNAPGAQIRTTADAGKLHQERKTNDFDALQRAFALLDPAQQVAARKLLEDRGITAPGSAVKPPQRSDDDGTPLK